MQLLSIGDFAERVGASYVMVHRALKQGRIAGTSSNPGGKITIDFDTQSKAWFENCKHPQKRPRTAAGGRPRDDGKPAAKAEQRKPMMNLDNNTKPDDESESGSATISSIQRQRELVKLQLDQLKLREAEGELVSAAKVQQLGHSLAIGIISVLYNIPERCSDEIAGMTDSHEIHKLLTSEIDAAVEAIRKKYVDPQ